jgi:putative ABC transport system substrate-binding protein
MNRRTFLAAISGVPASLAFWSRAVRAQQSERARRIVFLHALGESDPEILPRISAFRQGLEALGWIENQNIRVEHRYSGGDLRRMLGQAAEVVRSAPDLIVTSGTVLAVALKHATHTIPIVFCVVHDPVGQGLVSSLARPGGNITGFTFIDFPLVGKWVEILKEIAPNVRRMSLLFNPETAPWYPFFLRELLGVTASLAADVSATPVRDVAMIEPAITTVARELGGALICAPDPFINTQRRMIMAMAERHRLPAIWGYRQFVTEGALISYGPDSAEIVRRSTSYVDRILRGANPANLPVQAADKFELAININSANQLGITIPPTLLARADEVIE